MRFDHYDRTRGGWVHGDYIIWREGLSRWFAQYKEVEPFAKNLLVKIWAVRCCRAHSRGVDDGKSGLSPKSSSESYLYGWITGRFSASLYK